MDWERQSSRELRWPAYHAGVLMERGIQTNVKNPYWASLVLDYWEKDGSNVQQGRKWPALVWLHNVAPDYTLPREFSARVGNTGGR